MRDLRTRLRPWHIVLLLAIVYLAIVLLENQGDPFAFVRIGSRFDPGLPDGTTGYDGQFAYQIAVSPIGSVSKLDVPAYRLQRILYPALARIVALGNRQAVPWALVLVNLAALTLGVRTTEAILTYHGESRWWALAYGLNVGMLMSVRLDLTEPTAYMFVQVGALEWAHRRHGRSALAFCLASLTKEVTLLLALGYFVGELRQARPRAALKWAIMAFLPFAILQAILLFWLGRIGIASGGKTSTPFEVLPLHAWWGVARYSLGAFLTLSLLIVPFVIMPAVAGIFTSSRAIAKGFAEPSAISLASQSIAYLFIPSTTLLAPLGAARFSIGLVAAFLTFGAARHDRRVLAYTQLWLVTLPFLLWDTFLPHN